jgi:hypothetical protein
VTDTPSGKLSSRPGRFLDVTLPILASIVFVVVWGYVALALFSESPLPTDTWAWLESLDLVRAVVVWIALLPLGVFLWAWHAELEPIWFGLVMALLVGWTFLAWSGSIRALARRRRRD